MANMDDYGYVFTFVGRKRLLQWLMQINCSLNSQKM